jgi:hypothetical protein
VASHLAPDRLNHDRLTNLEKIAATYGANSKEYNQAKRAVDVYGAEGVKNGVTIYASKGGADGFTQVAGVAGAKTTDNPTGQNIHITFNAASFNLENFSEGLAHEGSHAADGSAWVKSGFANNKNPMEYQFELMGTLCRVLWPKQIIQMEVIQ